MGNWRCSLLIILFVMAFFVGISKGAATNSQTASLETVSTIQFGKQPRCVAINEETNRVYVGVNDSIIVLDGVSKQVLATIPYLNGNSSANPDWIIADSFNNQIFVEGYYVDVFNGTTNSLSGNISIYRPGRDEIALDSKRGLLYIADNSMIFSQSDAIRVYNATTRGFLAPMSIPGTSGTYNIYSMSVAVDSERNRIYARDSMNKTICVFDGVTRNLIKTGNYTTSYVDSFSFNPCSNRVYLEGGTEIIDANTLERITLPSVGIVGAFNANCSIVYAYGYVGSTYAFRIADGFSHSVFATLGTETITDFAVNSKTGEIYLAQPNKIVVLQGPSATKPLLISDLSINPRTVQAGQPVTITFKVTNLSNNSLTYSPVLKVGTSELSKEQVQLGNRENRALQFTVIMSIPGNYSVNAEGLFGILQVQDTIPPSLPVPDDGVSGWSNSSAPRFTWSASTDAGSGVAGYYYRVDNGPETWIISTSVTLSAQTDGSHVFYVKAKDNAGNNGTYGSHAFQIDKTPPSAAIAYPANGTTVTSASVTFGANSGADLSGIAGYSWDFGDGANGPGITATHTYIHSGTFAARLTVTDGAGNKATSVTTITVPETVVPEFSALAFLIVATATTLRRRREDWNPA